MTYIRNHIAVKLFLSYLAVILIMRDRHSFRCLPSFDTRCL